MMRNRQRVSTVINEHCTCRIPPPRAESSCTCCTSQKSQHADSANMAMGLQLNNSALPDYYCEPDYSDGEKVEYKIPRIKLESKGKKKDKDKDNGEIWINSENKRMLERNEELCRKCGCQVYATEKIEVTRNVIYHDRCFHCWECGIKLTLVNFCTDLRDKEKVFCRSHRPLLGAGHIDNTAIHINIAKLQPKLETVNGQIRGPAAGMGAKYDANSLCIQSALNTPRVWERPPSYFHTVNVTEDVIKGDIIGLKYL